MQAYKASGQDRTYLEMAGMPEFTAAVGTGESVLVVVNEHVIVQTVLTGERSITNQTDERFDT